MIEMAKQDPAKKERTMKFLHTSDWHIGRHLYTRKRYREHAAFLDWLAAFIVSESVDALLVAGDVFDTATPGTRAQELYYGFLEKVAKSHCRHVVVVGGNHDSPTFLDAPKGLLGRFGVHVVGAATEDPAKEVLLLKEEGGAPAAIVCAVPFLRDRDLRRVEAFEDMAEKDARLVAGIRQHYRAVCDAAVALRDSLPRPVPVIATGHLFAAGASTVEGDGVRELYVGSLAHVGGDLFPSSIDYLALGHLHSPQMVGGEETRRYSGSPLPMSFGEAGQTKSVLTISFSNPKAPPAIFSHPIPVFQKLVSLRGDRDTITKALGALIKEKISVWVEVTYTGEAVAADLREALEAVTTGTCVEILRIRNHGMIARTLHPETKEETLEDLSVQEVFLRCLDAHGVPEADRANLQAAHDTVVALIEDRDPNVG